MSPSPRVMMSLVILIFGLSRSASDFSPAFWPETSFQSPTSLAASKADSLTFASSAKTGAATSTATTMPVNVLTIGGPFENQSTRHRRAHSTGVLGDIVGDGSASPKGSRHH